MEKIPYITKTLHHKSLILKSLWLKSNIGGKNILSFRFVTLICLTLYFLRQKSLTLLKQCTIVLDSLFFFYPYYIIFFHVNSQK